MIHTRSVVPFTQRNSAPAPDRRHPSFTIFTGTDKHRFRHPHSSNRLPIRHIVYETLVEGIESVTSNDDFKGVITVGYQHSGVEHNIVFAMWFSVKQHLYFLTSLGQYSVDSYRKEMERFRTSRASDIHIKLALIHRTGLNDLEHKLVQSNLPRANVCLMESTIDHA